MRIRNKLFLAMAVPVGLLVIQIVLVNVFVRELQSAVTFISSAHSVIEDDFVATEGDLFQHLRHVLILAAAEDAYHRVIRHVRTHATHQRVE